MCNKISNKFSINARILRERAYYEGEEAAKSGAVCKYNPDKEEIKYNAWLTGYNNYLFMKEQNLVGFKSLSVGA